VAFTDNGNVNTLNEEEIYVLKNSNKQNIKRFKVAIKKMNFMRFCRVELRQPGYCAAPLDQP
jgi:acylphosphatase